MRRSELASGACTRVFLMLVYLSTQNESFYHFGKHSLAAFGNSSSFFRPPSCVANE